MAEQLKTTHLYDITSNYDRCVRLFRTTRKLLKLNIKLHDDSNQPSRRTIEQGDIFLFNHFSRFETFIPQYLIHTVTGDYCRSIAAADFFKEPRFASFLRSIGVVPNNLPNLFPFMAREILHGRKLIVFPEGGMVKDKQVIDDKGRFGIFSRSALARRKHHRGAAVIALALDAFKTALLHDYAAGRYHNIERWAEQLDFADSESLLIRALKPTRIVPSHITFHPLRVNDNILHQAARLFNKEINKRMAEELIIEGNLLFKHTDMDIRFSTPLNMNHYWKWWEKKLLPNVVHSFDSLDELFALTPKSGHWGGRIHAVGMQAKSDRVRDDYMLAMYQAVTVNLSHIASYIILQCYRNGVRAINIERFHKTLYVCIKRLQQSGSNLHRSLLNPEEYGVVVEGGSSRLQQFLGMAVRLELLSIDSCDSGQLQYCLQDKLIEQFDFDQIRTENLISVYANEIAPLTTVTRLISKVFKHIDKITATDIADYRFDDQLRAYRWDQQRFDKPRYAEINRLQRFTQDPNWYRLLSARDHAEGVLLVHGFMASPAELRELGDKFHQQGFHVLGVRLKGHGTSPWDLRSRNWQDWCASVNRGFNILKAYTRRIHIIGFSTGGLLALHHAVRSPDPCLASVISVSAPVEFRNKNMRFVPLLHQANKLVRWVSSEGLIPFRPNPTEHPDINYMHIPIRSLYQLQKLIEDFFARPANIDCPVTLFQSDHDPVVVPDSVNQLYRHILARDKYINIIRSNHHGIVFDNVDDTQQKIIDTVQALSAGPPNNPSLGLPAPTTEA